MIKVLLCLATGVAVALFTLNLRHQQLELNHQNADLHDQIKSRQARLWNQQLQIAQYTAPNAIAETVKGQQIDMVPLYPTQRANWITPTPTDPKAKKPAAGH